MSSASPNLSVLRVADTQLSLWRAGVAVEAVPADGTVSETALTLAVPAESVRLLDLEISKAEAKHLSKSLPFLLEEDVAEDIDGLHFAATPMDETRYGVAIISREKMAQLDAAVAEVNGLGAWIPEPLLLPWRTGECTLLLEGERVLLRWGRVAGAAVTLADLPLLLATLPETPESFVIYGEEPERLRAQLPAEAEVDSRVGSFASALMLVDPESAPLDLRQGDYAPRLPWQRWWQLWQPVAVAAAVAIVLQFGVDLAHWQRLEAENTALREAIQASYRRANPRGAVVDVERQLDRQLAGLRGGGVAGQPFTPLLTRVLQAVSEEGDIDLSTLNYSSSGDLRINMTAADFAAVEALRGRLGRSGLTATLEGTTARGERVAARLVVARS